MKTYIIMFVLLFSTTVFANEHEFFDTSGFTEQELACYSLAMIGFDSVVNRNAGILPENAYPNSINKEINNVDIKVAQVVYGGLLWEGSPHIYAIKTFGECVQNK